MVCYYCNSVDTTVCSNVLVDCTIAVYEKILPKRNFSNPLQRKVSVYSNTVLYPAAPFLKRNSVITYVLTSVSGRQYEIL
jgi:hypothetical protein